MAEKDGDNVSELAAFIGDAPAEDAPASSQRDETVVNDASEKIESESKSAETEPAKQEGQEPSPDKAKMSAGDAPKQKPAGPKDKTAEPAKQEPSPKSTWESDENPYRQRASEAAQRLSSVEQQLRDTRSYSNQVNTANQTMRRQMARMEAKIDGTFDPEQDKREEEAERSQAESPEQVAATAELKGATAASLQMAYEKDGKEKVDAEIREFDSLFQDRPLTMQRVLRSRRPIQEAMEVLSEYRITQKYGTRNLADLLAKAKQEAIVEARPKLVEEITKEIMGKLSLKDKENQGIRGARGASHNLGADTQSNFEPKTLKQLFPN